MAPGGAGGDAERRAHLSDRTAFRREVLELLHRLGLIAPDPAAAAGRGGWRLLAPAARYAAELGELPAGGTGGTPVAEGLPDGTSELTGCQGRWASA